MNAFEKLQAEIAKLQAENMALKQAQSARLKFKRSDKSEAIMLTGLRRFPVTFFEEEWAKVFSMKDAYEQFTAANPLSDAERARLKAIAQLNKETH